MTSAKLLSAVEPVIRYQRRRFRGGEAPRPGSPRYELGLQQKEDVAAPPGGHLGHRRGQRLAGLRRRARCSTSSIRWRSRRTQIFAERGITGGAAVMKAMRAGAEGRHRVPASGEAPADLQRTTRWCSSPCSIRVANVLCPACKLWNTGHGANMMREAVSLMGGYGITEDCPGFLGHKWMDAQLEATYEGPEAVQRRQLSVTMTNELFLAQFRQWIARDARASPPTVPAPAPARWPRPCSSGCGRSTTCRRPPTPTAPSSITARARA